MIIFYTLIPFISSFLYRPLSLFCIICFIREPSKSWAFCLIFSMLTETLIKNYLGHERIKRILYSLLELQNGIPKKYKLTELNSTAILKELFGNKKLDCYYFIQRNKKMQKWYSDLGQDFTTENVRIFKIETGENSIPPGLTVYSSLFTKTYILIPDNIYELTPIQKFMLLHELGHSTLGNAKLSGRRKTVLYQCILAFIVIAFSIGNYWLLIPLVIGLFFFAQVMWDNSTIESEIHADRWAISALNSLEERTLIGQKMAKYFDLSAKLQVSKQDFIKDLLSSSQSEKPITDADVENHMYGRSFKPRAIYMKKLINTKSFMNDFNNVPTDVNLIGIHHFIMLAVIIWCSFYVKREIPVTPFYFALVAIAKVYFDQIRRRGSLISENIKLDRKIQEHLLNK